MDPIRAALGLVSRAGARARLSIFIFHRVLAERDPLLPGEPDGERFDEILGWIASWFNVLPLDEAVRLRREGRLPARAASITFDDGYADNWSIALPLLRRRGLSATFFIATGFLDGGCMFNDKVVAAVRGCAAPTLDLGGVGLGAWPMDSMDARRRAIEAILGKLKYEDPVTRDQVSTEICDLALVDPPGELMLTTAQVRDLHGAGMVVGAHTANHPMLARVPAEAARNEIVASRDLLRELTGEPIELFAYPNGKPGVDYLPEHPRLVRELGFSGAVSTQPGAAGPATDAMELPRFTPWDHAQLRFGMRLVSNVLLGNRQIR